MAQMEKHPSYNLTTNDIPFSPSLNSSHSLSSSKGHLQTYNGEITHDQRKHDLISKSGDSIDIEEEVFSPRINHDSSITIQEEILSPRISEDSFIPIFQSDRPYTHILLQKNEKLGESDSELDSEGNECVCRSEKANQNYIVHIKSEPTTIVITRRGSTNSITAVGSCARFRAGGSDKEKSRKGKKKGKKNVPEEDSKAPLTVWERRDSDGKLSSTSGESIGARSTTDTEFKRSPRRNKENYFKRLSTRLSENRGRKGQRGNRPSSPHQKRDMTDDEFKNRVSKAFVPKDPRYFGGGRHKTAYEGEGEENANKSEGSNKREGRSKSFFSKGKPRRTPSQSRSRSRSRTRSRSKSKSPRSKRVPSKMGRRLQPQREPSEPFYVKETPTPHISYQSIVEESYPKKAYPAGIQHQYSQTIPFEVTNKPGPLCCTCGMPIAEKRDTYTEPQTEEYEKPHEHPPEKPESKPRRKMVLSVRSDVRSTVAYDAFVDGSEMTDLESYIHDSMRPDCCRYVAQKDQQPDCCRHAAQEDQPPSWQTPSYEQPETEEAPVKHVPKSPSYQTTAVQCSGPLYDHPAPLRSPARSPPRPAPPPARSPPRHRQEGGEIRKKPNTSDQGVGSMEAFPKPPVESEESTHTAKGVTYQPPPQPTSDHSSADKEDSIHVYCQHCGCGLQTVSSDFFTHAGRPPPPKDDNVSHVLWVLAKVTIFKDGSRNFEILESTSIPPGHYLMPGHEEFMIVAGNR